jgi:hypothetical protein
MAVVAADRPDPAEQPAPASSIPQDFARQEVAAAEALPPADPLDEAPEAVWYVRSAEGHQYGPADAAIMRAWVGEGRVQPDALVWREGWPGWREASEVLPRVAADPLALPASAESRSTGAAASDATLVAEMPKTVARAATARRSQDRGALLIVALALALLVLFAVFLWVLFRQPRAPTAGLPAGGATPCQAPARAAGGELRAGPARGGALDEIALGTGVGGRSAGGTHATSRGAAA